MIKRIFFKIYKFFYLLYLSRNERREKKIIKKLAAIELEHYEGEKIWLKKYTYFWYLHF